MSQEENMSYRDCQSTVNFYWCNLLLLPSVIFLFHTGPTQSYQSWLKDRCLSHKLRHKSLVCSPNIWKQPVNLQHIQYDPTVLI